MSVATFPRWLSVWWSCPLHCPPAQYQKMHTTTAKIIPTHLWTILHSSSMLCPATVFHWPSTWCEHQTQSRSAGSEEALSATSVALGDVKESRVGLSQNNCHPCVNSFLFETKTNAPTDTCIMISWRWPTFHYYIKVVNILSSRVFGCTRVFSPIPLVYSRYGQQLSKVVKFCPWRQLVCHFLPCYLRSGTTK